MSELINPFMHFQIIKDYRQESKVEHKLSDIILLTICGCIGHLILHFVRTIRVLERTIEQRLLQGSGRYV
nr:transposase family protein [Vibrio cholerae]